MERHNQENNPIENSPQGGEAKAFDLSGDNDGYWEPEYHVAQMNEQQGTEVFRMEGYRLAYEQKLERKETNQEQFKEFVDGLSGKEKWLDLGTGLKTAIVSFLTKMGKIKKENLISIDLDIKNLKYQQDAHKDGHKVLADASAIPLDNESIDVLVSHMMIADNNTNKGEKLEAINFEVRRVLKENGIFITDSDNELVNKDFKLIFRLKIPKGSISAYRKITK